VNTKAAQLRRALAVVLDDSLGAPLDKLVEALAIAAERVQARPDVVATRTDAPTVQNWWHIECRFSWGWERSGSYDKSYPTRVAAESVIKGIKSAMKYRVARSE
jgi:hypothetical protein